MEPKLTMQLESNAAVDKAIDAEEGPTPLPEAQAQYRAAWDVHVEAKRRHDQAAAALSDAHTALIHAGQNLFAADRRLLRAAKREAFK